MIFFSPHFIIISSISFLLILVGGGSDEDDSGCEVCSFGSKTTISNCDPCSDDLCCSMNLMASPLIRLSAPLSLCDSIAWRRAAMMSSSSQRDGWLSTSLVFMDRRRAVITFLPLLSSSTRASARDGVEEEEGGGSGLSGVWGEDSGEEAGRV